MKKLFNFLIIVLISTVIIIGILLSRVPWTNQDIPELNTQSEEVGKVVQKKDVIEYGYQIYTQKLEYEDYIDLEVNKYVDDLIDTFIKENDNTVPTLDDLHKGVFKSVIDTYKVSEDIVSVRITTLIKKMYEPNYTTSINAFNYNVQNKGQIVLDDLFKSGYKEKIQDIYSDNYLLKNTEIEFYTVNSRNTCTYNSLKEYNATKLLNAQNLNVSDDEYKSMFEPEVDKDRKMVAITFDDGPHATNTDKILKMLEEYNAKATFFMLGQNVESNKDVVKSVSDSGNEIGIHTWDHKQLTKLSADEVLSEVEKTSDAIYEITNQRPKLVRPPYGSFNDTVKSTLNYPLIMWSIDTLDWKSRDETKIVPLVMEQVQDGDIILLHDIHSTTVPAVEKILSGLKEADYQMVTVSQLLEAKGYDTSNTKVFYSGRQ